MDGYDRRWDGFPPGNEKGIAKKTWFKLRCNMENISFFYWMLTSTTFHVVALFVLLTFIFVFLSHKLYMYGLLLAALFFVFLIAVLQGPLGQQVKAKFKEGHRPTFQVNEEDYRKQRELMREYRDALKEMRKGSDQ